MKSKIPVNQKIQAFNEAQSDEEREICKILSNVISQIFLKRRAESGTPTRSGFWKGIQWLATVS